ncbi:hypothetical protein MVEG_06808 [Podila verticillata NRRL 6337]|nr:hypothetical protein MVEG_06808 [Podila verticillata NRRL 6337]
MFDISELDDIVCSQLELGSLAKCAQVNKKWNKVLAPFVWHIIPEDTKDGDWRKLCQLVLEDFLQEQQRTRQEQLQRTRRSTRAATIASQLPEPPKNIRPSPLAKNGPLVREVKCAAQLLTGLERLQDSHQPSKRTEYSNPTAQYLTRHFLQRCPNALMVFEMTNHHFNTPQTFRLALEVLPRVHTLVITAVYDGRKVFPVAKLKQVLATTSSHLDSLTINTPGFRASRGGATDGASSARVPEPKMTARPKKLKLKALLRSDCCQWLWRACNQVQELELEILSHKVFRELVQGVHNSMPALDTVIFSNYRRGGDYEVNDHQIAALLAAGTKGWKAVHCGSVARVGTQAVEALLLHASTLEEFSVARVQGTPGLARILKSCPRLRMFKAMEATEHESASVPKVSADDFVDWSQESKALQSWRCKARLETLAIRITDFPLRVRVLQKDLRISDEHYFEIHQRVLQRLGGLRHLKVLRLGHREDVDMQQVNCVRLMMEYGLEKLRMLKNLEELHIDNMDHHVTEEKEVEWMVAHWPKMRTISGLDRKSSANKWLRKNHPEIQRIFPMPRQEVNGRASLGRFFQKGGPVIVID